MHRNQGTGNPCTAFQVCRSNFRKWGWNPRIIAIALFVLFIAWIGIEPVRGYAVGRGLSISCWYYPFLFINNMVKIFFYFGVILLFCNAPFVDEQQMYVLQRTGRKSWFLGQMLYIVAASALYFLYVYLVSVAEFVPYVGFSLEWEKVIVELAQNSIGSTVGLPRAVVQSFTPVQAVILSYLINVSLAVLLGFVIFYVNLWKSRGYGVAVAIFWVFLTDLISNISGFYYLSPLNWCDIELFCVKYGGVKLPYAATVIILCGIILSILIMHRSKSYNIEALEEI